ncbi:MAG: GNAT family N-acetyltransferase [Ardenticatenia bacterium]|nr:GNAT family N-acetyltransferase [Ardenticatenia bacterium]
MSSAMPPVVIRTARLLIRSWQPGDGPLLKQAIDANLAHLRPWMPWALDEPSAPDVVEARVQQLADRFARGEDWIYALFAPDGRQVLGGSGLHPRIGPSGLEIGYWLDAAHTGRGLASEATAALTCAAFDLPQVDHVEIRCDPQNLASAAVPRRLGFRLAEVLVADTVTPTGEVRDTMVWRISRDEAAALGDGAPPAVSGRR